MNENKKLLIILGVLVLIGGCVMLSFFVAKEQARKMMIAYNSLFNEGESNIIVVGKAGCSYCETYIPVMETVTGQNALDYFYVDLSKLSDAQQEEVLTKLELTQDTFSGTPYTALVTDGKKVAEIAEGAVDEITLENFLIENKLIDGTIIEIEVDYKTFKDAYNSNDTKVLVRAASWCGNCTNLKKSISSLKKKYDFEVYYLYQDLLSAEEQTDYETFGADIESNGCGYPLTIATKNGKIIDKMCGYVDADAFKEFLDKHVTVTEKPAK